MNLNVVFGMQLSQIFSVIQSETFLIKSFSKVRHNFFLHFILETILFTLFYKTLVSQYNLHINTVERLEAKVLKLDIDTVSNTQYLF